MQELSALRQQNRIMRVAARAVKDITNDLRDRRGLDGEWQMIDAETQYEIRQTWEKIITDSIHKELDDAK